MIDVIITAYNAHKSIIKTLISIEMQTIKDEIKVYIVDDNSKKDYKEIKEMFKENLDIVLIRNKKNMGPGVSRQVGLNNSKSEYIVFIDSDDVFYDLYALENLKNGIRNADMAIGGIIEEELKNYFVHKEIHKGCLHGKMYRRSIIEKSNLGFCDSRNHEDNAFNFLYMNCCEHINVIDRVVYMYLYNSNSITKKNTNVIQNVANFIKSYTWLIEESIKRNIDNENIAGYIYYTIVYCYYNYLYYPKVNWDFMFEDLKKVKELYKKYDILEEEEKIDLYYTYIFKSVIPNMCLDEFIKKIK